MSIFDKGDVDEHRPAYKRVVELQDTRAEAFVVIDRYLGGGGTGGIRLGESVTLEEVATLAQEMTLKFAWLNIRRGGAKAGISYKGEMSKITKDRVLKEFGNSISDLLQNREYIAGTDLGIGPTELSVVMSSAGMQPETADVKLDIDSNYFTALTVFVSLKTLLQQKGEDMSGVKVLVEGVGKVSAHLMPMIVATGANIVGVSTIAGSLLDQSGIDIDKLLSSAQAYGDECVTFYRSLPLQAPEDLYLQSADVLVPGARLNSINEGNVDAIKARYVVPIANNSASARMEKMLFDRGISYIPGFVSNSGGIFCWYLVQLSEQARENIIKQGYARKVRGLIEDANRKRVPIAELARSQATNNGNRMALEGSSPFYRILETLRKLLPSRSIYITLRKVLGNDWRSEYSLFCKWYFDAKHFR